MIVATVGAAWLEVPPVFERGAITTRNGNR